MTVRLIRAFDGVPAGRPYTGTPSVEADLVARGNAAFDLHASEADTTVGTNRNGGVSFNFDVGGNDTVTLILSAPHGGRFFQAVTKCRGGSATYTFNINGVPMGATPNAVTTARAVQPIVDPCVFVTGDEISVTRSADATCVFAAGSIDYIPAAK